MNIDGHTKIFAVLGHPVTHTLSPAMHNASIKAIGMNAVYVPFDVHPDDLMDALYAMRDMGFGGVNLTVPLKEVAFKGIRTKDVSAQMLGAINTVKFLPDGKLMGFNTDGYGFVRAVKESFGISVKGSRIFVLGSGGAGRTIALTCAAQGAKHISIADIDEKKLSRLAPEVRKITGKENTCVVPVDHTAWKQASLAADLVVQATPVGMRTSDKPLLDRNAFRKRQMLYDLVYMYPETGIMKAARKAGAEVSNGLGMLLHQGACAFEIWTGIKPRITSMRKALEKGVYGR